MTPMTAQYLAETAKAWSDGYLKKQYARGPAGFPSPDHWQAIEQEVTRRGMVPPPVAGEEGGTPAPPGEGSAPTTQTTSATAVELFVTAGGIVTSLLVVVINLSLAESLKFDFLSVSFWLVVPAGAIFGGCVAASGYYVVAKWTQTMPNRRLLFNMVAVGLSTWLLYNWLQYYNLVLDDGTRVRDIASFWRYLAVAAEHMQLTFGSKGTTGELGKLGYAREALEAVGFMAGGFIVYGMLAGSEVCEKCRRYIREEVLLTAANPETFDALLDRARMTLPGVQEDAAAALGDQKFLGLDLKLLECPLCHATWLRPAVVFASGNNAQRAPLRRYKMNAGDAVLLRGAAAARKKR